MQTLYDVGYEKFTNRGYSGIIKASIRKNGQIAFNTAMVKKHSLHAFRFITLHYHRTNKTIACVFHNNTDEKSNFRLVKNECNCFIAAKSFLDYFEIKYGITNKSTQYLISWNDPSNTGFIKVK